MLGSKQIKIAIAKLASRSYYKKSRFLYTCR